MDHLVQSLWSPSPPVMVPTSLVTPTPPNPLAQQCFDTPSLLHPLPKAMVPHLPPRSHPRSSQAPRLFPADQTFGHPLPHPSGPNCLRLGYTNVAGFPVEALNNSRAMELQAFFAHHQVDIFAGCESNINWKKCPLMHLSMNGSALWKPFVVPLLTIFTTILASGNSGAPFF